MYVRTVSCVPAPKHEHARRRQTNRTVRSDEGQLIRLERPLTSDLISRSVVHQYININTSIHINTLRQKSGEAIYLWRLGPTKRATVKRRPGRLPLADDATREERRRFHREAAAAVATATATTLRLCLENKLYCLLFANLEIRGMVISVVWKSEVAKLRRCDVEENSFIRLPSFGCLGTRLVSKPSIYYFNLDLEGRRRAGERERDRTGSLREEDFGASFHFDLVPRVRIDILFQNDVHTGEILPPHTMHATIPTKRKEPERRPSSNSCSRSRFAFRVSHPPLFVGSSYWGGAAAQHRSLGLHSIRLMDGVMHCKYICIAVVT